MKDVGDLQEEMSIYEDVGVAMQIQEAIKGVMVGGDINSDDLLSVETLEKIRQKIYAINRKPDPMTLLFGALAGKTDNPIEAALQYIEALQENQKLLKVF